MLYCITFWLLDRGAITCYLTLVQFSYSVEKVGNPKYRLMKGLLKKLLSTTDDPREEKGDDGVRKDKRCDHK